MAGIQLNKLWSSSALKLLSPLSWSLCVVIDLLKICCIFLIGLSLLKSFVRDLYCCGIFFSTDAIFLGVE